MGAPLEMASQVRRIKPRQGMGRDSEGKPHQQAKKPEEKRNCSTVPLGGRCLIQPSDIEDALDWRLSGLAIGELEAIAEALRPMADDFREDRPEVATLLADLHRPGDRRSGWSLACAVLAWDGLRRHDMIAFGAALAEVLSAFRSSQGAKGDRHPLTPVMRELKRNQPAMTADRAFAHFKGLAADDHEILADYSDERDALILHDAAELSREAFCRQYRRL